MVAWVFVSASGLFMLFDIVGLMKGHVGDGAWSGGFKAPGTSFLAVICHVLT